MKLKCADHNRRVMVLDNAKTLHRSDGSECKTEFTKIGGIYVRPFDVSNWGDVPPELDMLSKAIHRTRI